jgi:luciferase family oxidoreductase group 1
MGSLEHQTGMSLLADTRFSVLDLALVKEGGSLSEAFRNSLDLARHVEQWGYSRFWLAEHHNMAGIGSAATSVLIGYIAAGTSTLRVGSGGVMLPNHSPLVIAEQFGTLETLYPGRIDLGVGRAPGSGGAAARALQRGLDSGVDEFPRHVQELLAFLGPSVPGQVLRAIPGEGTNVPVWLLGSSTYSAQLAAVLGLRFAFASHFAPEMMYEALHLYRHHFQPSKWLDKPYSMIGVPLVAAETDDEAHRLATTPHQRFLNLIRGRPIYTVPPVESMEGLWTPQERALVEGKLGVAVIGGPETVKQKLIALQKSTQADEFIFTSDLYDHADRLQSFEIAAEVMKNSPKLTVRPAELPVGA